MNLRIAREGNGLLGLYWCSALKQLALNLTPRFGLRLKFEFTDKEENEFAEKMDALLTEKQRVAGLSNAALVNEAMSGPAGDYETVIAMADRLDPEWYERDDD